MTNESESSNGGEWLAGMPIQSEKIAFEAEEMVVCVKCAKRNPPNRASCLYCASPIELPEGRKLRAKLNLRTLENWEKGYNIIFVPPSVRPDSPAIARYLSIDPDLLTKMLAARSPLPIARIESEAEADLVISQLRNFGLEAATVGDGILDADRPPTRLRAIEFNEDEIIVTSFNTGEQTSIGRDKLVLVVSGSVIQSRTESVEKRKKKETKLLQETETISDEKLFDIYIDGDPTGFRIRTNGFDFSCLGAEKGLVAADNIDRTKNVLLNFSPLAKTVDEYRSSVKILNTVWEFDRETDFHGRTRVGLGQSGHATLERSSNLTQFTKYSRLQRQLL